MRRKFLRLLTIILFAAGAFLLSNPLNPPQTLTTSLFLFLNFIIILGAICFGVPGVIIFGCLTLAVSFLYNLRIAELTMLPIFLLIITGGIFYLYCLKVNGSIQQINMELGNIDEEKNVLAVELEHSRLENLALKQKLQRYTTLKGLTEALSSTISSAKAISLITTETFRIIDKSNVCLFYLLDKEKQQLRLVSTKVADPHYEIKFKKGDILDHWVFKQRTRLMIADTKKDFRFNIQNIDTDLRGVRSLIAAPLISQNKLLGILRLDNDAPEAYDADDLRLLDFIADLAAVSIENTLLYQEMEKLAITDGLTGLFVHRHFQERFEQEISRAVWTNSQFALLMVDIDNFKKYNDKYGHIAGDIVLRQIAQIINATANPGDIVARYGGEEFGVLLVNTTKQESINLAEQIKKNIENQKFMLRREITEVRISGGLAFFPDNGTEREEIISRADQALYAAKRDGKNRICIY